MLITIWSVKGGSGVSVISAALASSRSRRGGDAVVVDLVGDQPAVLGLAEPTGPGLWDWLAAVQDGPAANLERLMREVAPGLRLLPAGNAQGAPVDRVEALPEALGTLAGPGRSVIVDAGTLHAFPGDGATEEATTPARIRLGRALAGAGLSIMVTRPCYLGLRRAARRAVDADGLILVAEAGRALDRRDVEQVLGLPVRGVVEVDPVVARAVDAGLLITRLPRMLERSLRAVT